jgi:phage terminase large subunit
VAGLEALRQYRADFDERTKAFKDKPRHDWTSHAADAFRYLAMAWRKRANPKSIPPKPLFKPLDEITWDESEELERADWRQERL